MYYIETESKDAAFHFSVEEYMMEFFPFDEPIMMIWQADKCAMLGNYQVAEAEIDMSYARQAGIQVVRRSSGGGTIFTDLDTFLFTVIQPYEEGQPLQQIAQKTVAAPLVSALDKIGVQAKAEGRNDILVEGKKISGMAQYVRHGRICSHGSLLYDTDMETLIRVLRVDEEKIRSKALRSIRSRVTNIKEHMSTPYSAQEFGELLKQKLFDAVQVREYSLTGHDLSAIEQIFQNKYNNPSWTFGKSPEFSFHNSKRFTGGKVEVYLNIIEGAVAACSIRGDFLGAVPIHGLEEQLTNKAFQYEIFNDALDGISLLLYLGNITKDELLSCIF